MAFNEEAHVQQLVDLYRQGFEQILQVVIEKEGKGKWTEYERQIMQEIYEILSAIDGETDKWIQQTVGQVYSTSVAGTAAGLTAMGLKATGDSSQFAQLHQRAIDVLAQNMQGNMRNATQFVGRRVGDAFRRAGVDQAAKKMATGSTWRDMQKKLTQELLDTGLTCFVDSAGRKWRLDSYAEMVARTTTREAASVAVQNECQEFGVDLVKVTTHSPTCGHCAPKQGKVFSLSGRDKRYPAMTDELRPPFHPHCRHVLTPYVREFDDHADQLQAFSNTSLTKDPRSDAEKQAYAEMRDKRTIATNRRRARQILYSQAPSEEKVKAAARLKGTYGKAGTKPVGRDASILKAYSEQIKTKERNDEVDAKVKAALAGADPSDRAKLAQRLLKNTGLEHIPATVERISDRGFCQFDRSTVLQGTPIKYDKYCLQENDDRRHEYQVKTTFHELYHAMADGLSHDMPKLGGLQNWAMVDDVFAECAAHALVKRMGITHEIMPSYSKLLIQALPRLKTLPEFKDCRTIADFGEVALRYRFSPTDRTAEWQQIYDHCYGQSFDIVAYGQEYKQYVMDHLDEVAAKAQESVPQVPVGVIKAQIKRDWATGSNDIGFRDSLIVAMNRQGVR